MLLFRILIIFLLFVFFGFLPQSVFAVTTPYRSAGWVSSDGNPAFSNISNCQITDGLYCSRPSATSYGNMYFSSFGTLDDFGIPQNAILTKIHLKITGKSSDILKVGVDVVKNSLPRQNCQNPFDLWWFYLGPNVTTKEYHNEFTAYPLGNNLANCFIPANVNAGMFTFYLNQALTYPWSADIDNFEIAFDYTPVVPSPTATPTLTPTPTPIPTPAPFLDLPWDYQGSSEQIVLHPGSWFDHHYPLQDFPCCNGTVLIFNGESKEFPYHSHSGYDYGAQDGVVLNTPVLAAAAGWATFEPESKTGGGGNVIKIDHGNGYQTWYEHLSKDDLVVSSEGTKVFVNKKQEIGKVGMTGSTTGPHIHLSVFKDVNNNGTFDDDYPYGLTDPLGWEGNYTDPWTEYGNGELHGATSYSLFLVREKPKSNAIPDTGGSLTTPDNNLQINVPANAYFSEFFLKQLYGPFESFISSGNSFISVAPSFFLNATNNIGDPITQFYQPIQIIYKYSPLDLLNIKEETLLIYFFNEQSQTWESLPSVVDIINKTVSAQTWHFSHFALMGEAKDLIAPKTEIILNGDKGQDNWYRSTVQIELNGKDNDGGSGLQYTLYTLNGDDWFEYKEPLLFENDGEYSISYQSFDKAGNEEKRETKNFHIDKILPEAKISYDQTQQDLIVSGIDTNLDEVMQHSLGDEKQEVIASDKAGNTLKLRLKDWEHGKESKMEIQSLQYNSDPVIDLIENKMQVKYNFDSKKNIIKNFDQEWEFEDQINLKLKYLSKEDKTTISKVLNEDQKQKDVVDGLKILQIFTEKGTLKFSY